MIANGYGFLYGDDENILKFDIDDIVYTLNYTELYKMRTTQNPPPSKPYSHHLPVSKV